MDLTDFGKPPLSVLVLQVERAYFQCSKSVMRSGLWDPERRVDRSVFPPFSQVLRDHCRDAAIPDEAQLRAGLRARGAVTRLSEACSSVRPWRSTSR